MPDLARDNADEKTTRISVGNYLNNTTEPLSILLAF